MSGIYIHIPFCKKKCSYCDFHFSTSLKYKDDLITSLIIELELRKKELANERIETIYFGGGTPSILSADEIRKLLNIVYQNYDVIDNPEISLEANPDDLTEAKILELHKTRINRLSIGIQSFFDDDLKVMNRAHNASESKECLSFATSYFDNITIDLIYGVPNMSIDKWTTNVQTALDFGVSHISSYALTVEPKTALKSLIKKGKIESPNEYEAHQHFLKLVKMLNQEGFVHYELSNFGKPNFFSKHNTSYWTGTKYVGIGPSAHSFDGNSRSWNIANNMKYITALNQKTLPSEKEKLSLDDQYNEYVMTGLRTIWGVSIKKIENDLGFKYVNYLRKNSEKYIQKELLKIEENILKTTAKGKFLTDGIAADLFKV